MGRSVNYLNNANYVTYINHIGSENEDLNYMPWEDFTDEIIECFAQFPSLRYMRETWEHETRIILANDHAQIGLSDYCGCVSISIRVSEDAKIGLAEQWINIIWPKVLKIFTDTFGNNHLVKIGTFSNGESIYKSRF